MILDSQANLLPVNIHPTDTDLAALQPFEERIMGAVPSKEDSAAQLASEAAQPLRSPFSEGPDDSGQIPARSNADLLNQLALTGTASSSSAPRKNTTLLTSPLQSPGKRKRQPTRDVPDSPSKRTVPERGGSTKARGRLSRLSRALSDKATNNGSKMSSTKDPFAVENMSPVKPKRFYKSGKSGHRQKEVHTDKARAKSSSPAHIDGNGAESEPPTTAAANVEHVSDPDSGSPNRREVTRVPPKPKGRPKKQQQPPEPSASDPRPTRSGNHNLRSGGAAVESKNGSKRPEHDLNAKPSTPISERAVLPPETRTMASKGANTLNKANPVRKDDSTLSGNPPTLGNISDTSRRGKPSKRAHIAETSYDVADALNGNDIRNEDGAVTSGNQGVQLGSSEHATGIRHDGDGNGPEGGSVDKYREEGEAGAEDTHDSMEQNEVNDREQMESTKRFLLRGPDWDKVLDGAKTVGVSKIHNEIIRGKPQLETKTIKAFVKQVRKTSKIYHNLGLRSEVEPEAQELDRQVKDINEVQAGNKKSEMIQDIYAHAIPELVFMLDKALHARKADCSLPDDVKGLKEITRLQDITIRLCEKAQNWSQSPVTDRPIKNSTRQKIYPYLRTIRKAFLKEIDYRQRGNLRKKDEAAAELDRKRREEEIPRKHCEDEKERLAIWDKINEQLDRNERILFRRKPTKPLHTLPPIGIDDWTEEQELVLFKYLEAFGDIQGERRYGALALMQPRANRVASR